MLKPKVLYLALLCLLMFVLTFSACVVSQDKYDKVVTDLAAAQSEIEKLQGELATHSDTIRKLQGDLTTQSATVAQLESSNTILELQVSKLQRELGSVLNTIVTQYYQFSYKWGDYFWTLPIPLRDYFHYKEKLRPSSLSDYSLMAADPNDDYLINNMVRSLDEVAVTKNLSRLEKTNFVIAFIQSLPYTEDVVTTPYDEYPRYPVETLFDRGGDCEDTSILAAALLTEMGYDVVLLVFKEQKHIAVGVSVPNATGYYWEYEGKKYFYLETTGEGWQIGERPPGYTKTYVYPVGK